MQSFHQSRGLERASKAAGLAIVCGALLFAVRPALAQVNYQYTGNPFTLFSCGGTSYCASPGPNTNTSYTATDVVTATLSVSSALPANMAYGDVSSLPGFKLTLNDGHQTMTATAGYAGGFIANVSTDSSGNIAQWALVVNCCFYPNNGIATANDAGGNGIFDQGTLSAPSPNNGYPNTPFNAAMNTSTPGTWGPSLSPGLSGTAARVIMTGSAYGMSVGTIDGIFGGDGKTNTAPWNFAVPAGWSYARGSLSKSGPQAGAYSATSGPCGGSSGASCGVGAGRGVAYRTYSNMTSQPMTLQVNAMLDGSWQFTGLDSGGVATAGAFFVDATAFSTAVSNSGLPTPQFLLNSSNITALGTTGAGSLASLFPSGSVLWNYFKTIPITTQAGSSLSLPITSPMLTVAPNQSVTLVFDVSAYALNTSSVNFASTLAPSSTLPLFTDANGNAVTLTPTGPTLAAAATPASLVLTPTAASLQAGATANVTATVTDSSGNPVPNAVVFVAFSSGPNLGPTGPISTDNTGTAVFTYPDNGGAGTDVIQATLGALTATPVTVTWTSPGPLDHITISPATATIAYGSRQNYTATAYDRFNTAISDVTSQTAFSISTANGACTGSSCTASSSGTYTVTGTYSGKTAQASLIVSPILQTKPVITWATPAPITYGTALSVAQLNATASVAGSFSYSPQTGQVLGAGTQTLSVTFTPTDTTHYTNATATVNLQVTQAQPVITWATPAPVTAGTALSATQLNATANVAGSFAYSPMAGTVLAAGSQTLKVTFTPTDGVDYIAASGQVTLVVNPAGKTTPSITWATPAPITYGTPLGSAQLNATATVAGTFSYSPKAGTLLTAGSQVLTVTFVPSNTSTYNNATAGVTLQVNKATPAVLWVPLPLICGIPLGPLQLDALTLVPGKFSYAPGTGALLPAGLQPLSATFTPSDTSDYTAISVHATLLVLKAYPVIKWAAPGAIVVGTPLSATQLNATANVAGTFVYSPAAGTKLTAGTAILNVSFTPADSGNYQNATAAVSMTVKSH